MSRAILIAWCGIGLCVAAIVYIIITAHKGLKERRDTVRTG